MTQEVCESAGLRACVIGGIALQRRGEPCYTADADLSVLVEPGHEAAVVDALLARLAPRIENAAAFAAQSRVILARAQRRGHRYRAAGLPYEARVMERSSPWILGAGAHLRTCSAKDLWDENLRRKRQGLGGHHQCPRTPGRPARSGPHAPRIAPVTRRQGSPELAQELERRIERHLGRP